MEKNHATPILASYVTYKELSSHGNYKSPYQILAEFILDYSRHSRKSG